MKSQQHWTAKVLACCLLAFPLVGSGSKVLSKLNPLPQDTRPVDTARRDAITTHLHATFDVFRAGNYLEALAQFQAVSEEAKQAHFPLIAARALGDMGSCQFALHRYRPALQSFLEAHRQAQQAGDSSAAAVFEANIASLYSELGELDSAAQWMENSLGRISAKDSAALPKILIQLATLRARQKRMPEAIRLFDQGIDAADRAADLPLVANAWNRLGEEYLKVHELAEAEVPLLEAYRLRKLNHLPLDTSYRNLGRLRLEQGDFASASNLLDRAVELSAQPQSAIPSWDVYHYRGRVRMAQGRLAEAVSDLRLAVRLARDWRWNAPPDDAAQMGAEGWLDLVHSAFVEAGNRLYLQNHDPALIRETFEAVEENRARSLRSVLTRRQAPDSSVLPPAYWDTLSRLQRAEVKAIRSGDTTGQETTGQESVAAIRAELVRMEAALGGAIAPLPAALLDRTRASLGPERALLSFHLGDSVSWLWALDHEGLLLYQLPPREQIEKQVQAATASIRAGTAAPDAASAALWKTLFGQLAPRVQRTSGWLVALDRGLFEAPLAALEDGSQQPPAYLVERHAIESVPGAGFWLESLSRPPMNLQGPFLGVGDPIYNAADPRRPKSARTTAGAQAQALLLPRLVGSGTELDGCSRDWRGERVLLRGADASRQNLAAEMQKNPAVIHLAAHVLESSERPTYGLIALSLTPKGENELLPPFEIANWHTNAALVVLSGCHSGEGAELPGTGLLGLTRAWLMAGAHSVIGSNWPTPDESGALFSALYRNLTTNNSKQNTLVPSAALRAAQQEMIHSGGWRANPGYWGAYFMVGSE